MNDFKTDEAFDYFLEEFGKPQHVQAVSAATVERYRGTLPDRLLEYWQEYGFCSFRDGLFKIVDPYDYEHVLESWLGEEILATGDFYVIAATGFGDLFVWGKHTGYHYDIALNDGWVILQDNSFDEQLIKEGDSFRAISDFFAMQDIDDCDNEDEFGKRLFERCVQKYGVLEHDEVFTFVPPIALGGKQLITKVQKVNVHVHADIMKELIPIRHLDREGLGQIAFGEGFTEPQDFEALLLEANTSSTRKRIEANQACPKTGYWFTPAKLGSRAHFNRGDTMPDFAESEWEQVIWQWDENQDDECYKR